MTRRPAKIEVRVSQAEKDEIVRRAEALGLKVSDFIRTAALEDGPVMTDAALVDVVPANGGAPEAPAPKEGVSPVVARLLAEQRGKG